MAVLCIITLKMASYLSKHELEHQFRVDGWWVSHPSADRARLLLNFRHRTSNGAASVLRLGRPHHILVYKFQTLAAQETMMRESAREVMEGTFGI